MRLGLSLAAAAALSIGACPGSLEAGTPSVGTFVSSHRSFTTASYWIAAGEGLVLVDTQFLPSEAVEFVERAERQTGKKAKLAFVLHPNPDKFNGTAVLQARGIEVLTSEQVRALIPEVHALRLTWFGNEYAPEYPRAAPLPASFGSASKTFELGDVKLVAHVLGPGCSGAHVVLQSGDDFFVGDLVNPANHAWLELGLIDDWIARLEELRAMKPKRIYPGRGPAGAAELIDRQIEYLHFVQQTVRESEPQGELGFWRKMWLAWQVENRYPQLSFPGFMRDGLPKVWEAEVRRAAATAPPRSSLR
jgi:glyoxylase-like metal-dependent hydrolase (beta-lactamase superfamily II)